MVEIIKLVRTDFDNLENHDTICKKEVGLFITDEKNSAHYKLGKLLEQQGPIQLYLGWDGNVYPKFDAYVIQSTEIEAIEQTTNDDYVHKETWNCVMKLADKVNGRCKKHDYVLWWGFSEIYPNTVGFVCPQCEKELTGRYSKQTIEIYAKRAY